MSPQKPDLNRKIWQKLEAAVRTLDSQEKILETYVITGPIFDFMAPIEVIGKKDRNGISIPIPSHFFKCALTENLSGRLHRWAFEMKNQGLPGPLDKYKVTTAYIEQRAGISLWDNLTGPEIEKEKNKKRKMWKLELVLKNSDSFVTVSGSFRRFSKGSSFCLLYSSGVTGLQFFYENVAPANFLAFFLLFVADPVNLQGDDALESHGVFKVSRLHAVNPGLDMVTLELQFQNKVAKLPRCAKK